MKKIILALMIVLMISNVWAGECPNEPPLCLDLNINATDSLNIKGGNLIIGDGCSAITPDGEDACIKGDVGVAGDLTIGNNDNDNPRITFDGITDNPYIYYDNVTDRLIIKAGTVVIDGLP